MDGGACGWGYSLYKVLHLVVECTQEGIELVSATHGFKFEAPDGKLRVADVLNSEGVVLLAKNYPTNRANDFLNWFTYSDNTIDGQFYQ